MLTNVLSIFSTKFYSVRVLQSLQFVWRHLMSSDSRRLLICLAELSKTPSWTPAIDFAPLRLHQTACTAEMLPTATVLTLALNGLEMWDCVEFLHEYCYDSDARATTFCATDLCRLFYLVIMLSILTCWCSIVINNNNKNKNNNSNNNMCSKNFDERPHRCLVTRRRGE